MIAQDIMTSRVYTVGPDATVQEVAKLLLERRISGVPVVDDAGRMVGIVSEGDLLRRHDIGTETRHSWWLKFFADTADLSREYTKTHGRLARDVMTKNVITVSEDTAVSEVAEIMESNHIKRVPVVRDGELVGIISRANIIQRLAAAQEVRVAPTNADDASIRAEIERVLGEQPWASTGTTNVTVSNGVVEFWGTVGSEAERDASRVAIEGIAGVTRIEDRRAVHPIVVGEGL